MIRSAFYLTACTTALLIGAEALAHDHASSRGRLIFSDHEKPVVGILDLDTGEVTHQFAVSKAGAMLLATENGRHVIVRTGDDKGTIRILDSGLHHERHEDHVDIDKEEPGLLDLTFTGDRPSHVVSENGWTTLFYDGQRPWLGKSDHKVVLIETDSLDKPQPTVDVWPAPAPQHGIAVPLGGGEFLISVVKEAYARGDDKTVSSRPDGFAILDRAQGWKVVASFNDVADPARSCKEFHGHASLKNVHAFGCNAKLDGDARSDGGVLIVGKAADGRWGSRKLAYPDLRRTSTIKGVGTGRFLVGNYGGANGGAFDALVRIDPQAEALATADVFAIPGGTPVCQYEVTDDSRVVNLTSDGKLRIYALAPAWAEVASFDAVAPFDCAWDARTPAPTVAVIGGSAFVSDPVNGRIREFYLNTLKQGLDLPVGGLPTKIAGGGNAG
jgi:hypothetical protein